MKNRSQITICILLTLFLVVGITGCRWQSLDFLLDKVHSSNGSSNGGSQGNSGNGGTTPLGLVMISISGDTVTVEPNWEDSGGPFSMGNLPVTVNSFKMAQTELTYEKWYEVYQWAIQNGYSFGNAGMEGSRGAYGAQPSGNNEPVTGISWRDAIVWCNAASEREGLVPVYLYGGSFLRDSTSGNADQCTILSTTNGYRLPTSAEWEYAARGGYQNSSTWNQKYAGTDDVTLLDQYAVYNLDDTDPSTKTSTVGSRMANSCNLFDMSGNVFEYCFDSMSGNPSMRVSRGGRWCEDEWSCCMQCLRYEPSNNIDWGFGFRVVQNN